MEHLEMLEFRAVLASGSPAPAVGFAVDYWAETVIEDTNVLEKITT